MQSRLEFLTAEALKLTAEEREIFVQSLTASLDQDAAVDEVWATEVERRIVDVESGKTQVIPMADALTLVRAGLK